MKTIPRVSYKGESIPIDVFASSPEIFESAKQDWLRETDPSRKLSIEQHQDLWKNNIKLQIKEPGDQSSSVKLEAFGLSGTLYISEKRPKLFEELMEDVQGRIVGERLEYSEIAEMLVKLKKRFDVEWSRVNDKEFPKVLFRVSIGQHKSIVRNASECWLTIDAFQTRHTDEDIFRIDFLDTYLRFQTSSDPSMFFGYFLPDPRAEEEAFVEKTRPTLTPNRHDVKVVVQDDKLSRAERERVHGFSLVDETKLKSHQVEGFVWDRPENLDHRQEAAIEEAVEILRDRIPSGSVIGFDELHLRVGNAAKALRRSFPDYQLKITVFERDQDNHKYTALRIEVD